MSEDAHFLIYLAEDPLLVETWSAVIEKISRRCEKHEKACYKLRNLRAKEWISNFFKVPNVVSV